MASMEDTSDCESVVGVFTLVKKVESKQNSLDYFKKADIRKTIQLHGWRALKCCKTCSLTVKPHGINAVLRYEESLFFIINKNDLILRHCTCNLCNSKDNECPVKYK
jgi:hypothetical protein